MRVWVSSYHAYNCGSLAGFWVDAVDADMTSEEWIARLPEEDRKHLPDPWPGAHEELNCFDVEGFAPWVRSEMSPWDAARRARLVYGIVEEASGVPVEAVLGWLTHEDDAEVLGDGVDVGEVAGRFVDAFRGEYESLAEFGRERVEEFGPLARLRAEVEGHPSLVGLVDELEGFVDMEQMAWVYTHDDFWSMPSNIPGMGTFGVFVYEYPR